MCSSYEHIPGLAGHKFGDPSYNFLASPRVALSMGSAVGS